MADYVNPLALAATTNYLADNGDRVLVCTSAPTDYAEAVAAAIAQKDLTVGDGNSNYSIATDGSGNSVLTIAEQPAVYSADGGAATHIALVDTANSRLLAVRALPGGTVTIPAGGGLNILEWTVTVEQPA